MISGNYHHKILPFIEYLESITERPVLEDLIVQMQAFDITKEELGECVRFQDSKYCRNLIFENEYVQLLCICWKNGQQSPIHDHAESICGVKIIEGIATETIYEKSDNSSIKPLASVDYPAGVIGCKDTDIHGMSNLQEDNKPLVTLHCYSPPMIKTQIFTADSSSTNLCELVNQ